MDWGRAKSVLIAAFLVLNAVLGYQLWQEWRLRLDTSADWTSLPSETQQVMQEKNIRVEAQIPADTPALRELAFAVVERPGREAGDRQPLDPPRDTRIVYFEKELQEELGDVIPELGEYALDTAADREGVFTLNRMAGGLPMFDIRLELYHSEQKITAYRQDRIRLLDGDDLPEQRVLPAAQALARLIEIHLPAGSVVEEVRLGYHGQFFDAETQYSAPTWRVLLENGEIYYVHAISGEVGTEEEASPVTPNGRD